MNSCGKPLFQKLSITTLCLLTTLHTVTLPNAEASPAKESYVLVNLAEDAKPGNMKNLSAKVVIDAPVHSVWQTMTNYPKLKEFMPGYKNTTTVSQEGCSRVLDVVMTVANFLPNYKYRLKIQENRKSYELKINRLSGDFEHLSASYQLLPQKGGNQTLLVYTLNIDPGSGIPGFTINPILKNSTEKTLKAIQKRSLQDYQKTVIGQNTPDLKPD